MTTEELAQIISIQLRKSSRVQVDGLGIFARDDAGCITFSKGNRPRIFVAYATEDFALANRLFRELEACGYAPWLDRRKLLPGQNWPLRIQDAIESSDFFIACYSRNSVSKRGGFQAEVRCALECATHIPLDDVFFIPVRLDDCRVPPRIKRETQYVDLFPVWKSGIEQIVTIVERQRLRAV